MSAEEMKSTGEAIGILLACIGEEMQENRGLSFGGAMISMTHGKIVDTLVENNFTKSFSKTIADNVVRDPKWLFLWSGL